MRVLRPGRRELVLAAVALVALAPRAMASPQADTRLSLRLTRGVVVQFRSEPAPDRGEGGAAGGAVRVPRSPGLDPRVGFAISTVDRPRAARPPGTLPARRADLEAAGPVARVSLPGLFTVALTSRSSAIAVRLEVDETEPVDAGGPRPGSHATHTAAGTSSGARLVVGDLSLALDVLDLGPGERPERIRVTVVTESL